MAAACGDSGNPVPPPAAAFSLEEVRIGTQSGLADFTGADPAEKIVLRFSEQPDETSVMDNIRLAEATGAAVAAAYACDGRTVTIAPEKELKSYSSYTLVVQPDLLSAEGTKIATGKVITIGTGMDDSDKFERIDDEELLTLVQQRTFGYFWDFGHPVSGLARERSTSGDVVTTGGSGFGIMAMTVAAERGFVSRTEAAERMLRIVEFLATKAARFHGAFPHWLNGRTGAVQPFSEDDNGADLVETALLMQGLLTARAYFDGPDATEMAVREGITQLWEAVEWDFFTKEGTENQLYWHWSPDKGWKINLPVTG